MLHRPGELSNYCPPQRIYNCLMSNAVDYKGDPNCIRLYVDSALGPALLSSQVASPRGGGVGIGLRVDWSYFRANLCTESIDISNFIDYIVLLYLLNCVCYTTWLVCFNKNLL